MGLRFEIGSTVSLPSGRMKKEIWKAFQTKMNLKKIEEELKNHWRKTERKHRIKEGKDRIRLKEFGRTQAAYNIIFTLRTYVLGPAFAGHPACAGS